MRFDTFTSLLVLAGQTSAGILDGLSKNLCVEATTMTNAVTVTVEAMHQTTLTATYTVTNTPSCAATQCPLSSNTAACLSDEQTKWIVDSFKTILSHPDRSVAKSTADELIADEFLETSDSINSLSGLPADLKGVVFPMAIEKLGNTTFASKESFVKAMANGPAIPGLTTLDVFHTCSRIVWYWSASVIKGGVEDVRGVSVFYATADKKQVNMAMVEFNSLAWAKLLRWNITRPDGSFY